MKTRKKTASPAKPGAKPAPPPLNIRFRIRYRTNPGQQLFVTGNHPALGSGDIEKALALAYHGEESWEGAAIIEPSQRTDFAVVYNYFVRESDGSITNDWGDEKQFNPARETADELLLVDSWNYAGFVENVFFTKPFQKVFFPPSAKVKQSPAPGTTTHLFQVKAPLLGENEAVCLCGDGSALGNWNTASPLLLAKNQAGPFHSIGLDLRELNLPAKYKYGIFNLKTRAFIKFESLDFRLLNDAAKPGCLVRTNDGFLAGTLTHWKGAGVAIPVFSLRSETSFGVGEFADLKLLADWCRRTGLKLIQILPINDTMATQTWSDSYPYAAISAFALHPIYLNLKALAGAKGKPLLAKLEAGRKRLNALPELDYEAVLKTKMAFLRKIFETTGKETLSEKSCREFVDQNKHWLLPYAAFCHFRDKFGTSEFATWPEFSNYDEKEIEKYSKRNAAFRRDVDFNCFLQFHLDRQLRDAVDYAHKLGVAVKGDLPIGIYRHGADAWQQPELYNMNVQAGAPPDPFAAKGQNWGFPTYNWKRMQEDGFAWWKQRCSQISRYFDAFRIDHILGFFRIWSIPIHAVEGIMGYFVPALPLMREELAARGIHHEAQRLTQPFITDAVLHAIFGEHGDQIKKTFLTAAANGQYFLRPAFRTQRAVEAHFAALKHSETNEKLKTGLYDLISNVILFEIPDTGGRQFHFRLGMDKTSSFQNLDEHSKFHLNELYIDYFYRRQDAFWKAEAMLKLPALKRATDMLVCGEDLGMVPGCVPEVMRRLALLSLEIQRMPKDPAQDFSEPSRAPYLSVVTPSTHDMSTIRGWWAEEDKPRIRKFYKQQLNQPGDPPPVCEGWINRAIVVQHLESPAMWSIFQLQDILGMDEAIRLGDPDKERINIPAIVKHYWRYRMHLTLEKLNKLDEFNAELAEYVKSRGR